MKFAIPFSRNFNYFDDKDNLQLNIIYKRKVKQLDDFIASYGSYRINLLMTDFNNEKDGQLILALKEKYPDSNLVIAIAYYSSDIEQELNELGLDHYYNELITSWDKFQGFLTLNVTDIFVAEELAFSAEILSNCAKEKGISLRCYCNVCQSSWEKTPSLKTFFIRPEDMDVYEKYFDVIEFYVDRKDINRINILYKVYAKTRKWIGKLNQIIVGYQGEEYSYAILPKFGEKRINCRKRCALGSNYHCHLCDHMASTGEFLRENGIYFDKQ